MEDYIKYIYDLSFEITKLKQLSIEEINMGPFNKYYKMFLFGFYDYYEELDNYSLTNLNNFIINDYNILLFATRHNKLNLIKYLVSRYINLYYKNTNNETAEKIASDFFYLEISIYLYARNEQSLKFRKIDKYTGDNEYLIYLNNFPLYYSKSLLILPKLSKEEIKNITNNVYKMFMYGFYDYYDELDNYPLCWLNNYYVNNYNILYFAIIYKKLNLIKYLVSRYIDLNLCNKYYSNMDTLICAIHFGNFEIFKYIFDRIMNLFHHKDSKGNNIYNLAAFYNRLKILKFLENTNINKLNKNKNNNNALCQAIIKGNLRIVKYLLSNGIFLSQGIEYEKVDNINHILVAKYKRYNIIKYYKENVVGFNIDKRLSFQNYNILLYCCIFPGYYTFIKKIIALGANIHILYKNIYNFNAYSTALYNCNIKVAKYLESIGVNIYQLPKFSNIYLIMIQNNDNPNPKNSPYYKRTIKYIIKKYKIKKVEPYDKYKVINLYINNRFKYITRIIL